MAHLLTVRALYAGPILRLGALSALVTFGVTVAANNLPGIRAVLLAVTFLTTVVASTTSTTSKWAITREMSNLIALLTLDTLGRTWLGTLLGTMTALLAVTAGKLVGTRVWTFVCCQLVISNASWENLQSRTRWPTSSQL